MSHVVARLGARPARGQGSLDKSTFSHEVYISLKLGLVFGADLGPKTGVLAKEFCKEWSQKVAPHQVLKVGLQK